MHQPLPLMAAGLPAAAAAAAPGIMGLPANNSPAKGEYLQSHQNASLMSSLDSFHFIPLFLKLQQQLGKSQIFVF